MSDLKKDIITGLILLSGLYGFLEGEYIIAALLFAIDSVYSNVWLTRRLNKK